MLQVIAIHVIIRMLVRRPTINVMSPEEQEWLQIVSK